METEKPPSNAIANLLKRVPLKHLLIASNWKSSMNNGDICYSSPIGSDTIRIYLNSAQKIWQKLDTDYSNLDKVIIKAIEVCRPDQYSSRRHLKEAGISLAKYLISKGIVDSINLDKLKAIKIKRTKEPYRPTRKPEDLDLLLKINNYLQTTQDSKNLNKILLKFAFWTGLRVSEICNMRLNDVFLEDSKIQILNGKHGKNRWVAIHPELKKDLEKYIYEQRPKT